MSDRDFVTGWIAALVQSFARERLFVPQRRGTGLVIAAPGATWSFSAAPDRTKPYFPSTNEFVVSVSLLMADLASLGGVSAAVGSEARSLFSHNLEGAKNRSANDKTDPKDSGLVQYADDEEDRNEDDDDEGDEIRVSGRRGHLEVRRECPYLDTVNRQLLDFDFEKFCSVSLSNLNVYGCLVCGKYFQGRARSSHAVTHSVDAGHHVFINLHTEKVYCLPDGYQVSDPSLDDIKSVLNPRFTAAQIEQFDRSKQWARALDGTDYIPGMVGLNNIKDTGYVNVITQSLMRVTPLRNFFLLPANYTPASHSPAAQPSALVRRFGELVRKVWHPRNFKGQVSPHEFLQAIMLASKKRFLIGQQSDPLDLLSWLLNTLHADLAKSAAAAAKAAGKKAHRISSIIQECFQGELEVIKEKFDGQTVTEVVRPHPARMRYRITRLPRYLILHMKRFKKNNFFIEKNPTLVNFPVKNLELKDYLPLEGVEGGGKLRSKYDLIANIVHDGKPGEGSYRAFVQRKAEEAWYEMQDLHVTETLPQMVALSEAYIQIYEQQQD
ncbi:unnamed protein product [Closterium sp. Yama58-4]|nr:unnamed protein product [Closterium sp. Yama58-4]